MRRTVAEVTEGLDAFLRSCVRSLLDLSSYYFFKEMTFYCLSAVEFFFSHVAPSLSCSLKHTLHSMAKFAKLPAESSHLVGAIIPFYASQTVLSLGFFIL